MSDQDDFDEGLAASFGQEHRHVPADAFVAATMRKVRAARRRKVLVRFGLRVAVLVAAVAASPWLTAGAARLNAALESSLAWIPGLPGAWLLGVLAVVAVAARLRWR